MHLLLSHTVNTHKGHLLIWAKENGVTLADLVINFPSIVSSNGNGSITVGPSMFDKNKKDGSSACFITALRDPPGESRLRRHRVYEGLSKRNKIPLLSGGRTGYSAAGFKFLDKDIKDNKVENLIRL